MRADLPPTLTPNGQPSVLRLNNGAVIFGQSEKERDGIRDRLLERLGAKVGNWTIRPKRWKQDGTTYYGIWLERKL